MKDGKFDPRTTLLTIATLAGLIPAAINGSFQFEVVPNWLMITTGVCSCITYIINGYYTNKQ